MQLDLVSIVITSKLSGKSRLTESDPAYHLRPKRKTLLCL